MLAVRSKAGKTAPAVETVTAGFVTAITVVVGEPGYTYKPTITIAGVRRSGATATAGVENGKSTALQVTNSGIATRTQSRPKCLQ